MNELLQNEHFWVYLAFVIFIIIFGKLIYKQIKLFLEEQISNIKENIDNSKKPLEESVQKLKKQKAELALLNQKIQIIKQKDKDSSNMLVEGFYDNLSIKIQYLEESFKSYIKDERAKHLAHLANTLVNDSYELTLNLLKTKLDAKQKQQLLNDSIEKMGKVLTSKNIYEH